MCFRKEQVNSRLPPIQMKPCNEGGLSSSNEGGNSNPDDRGNAESRPRTEQLGLDLVAQKSRNAIDEA